MSARRSRWRRRLLLGGLALVATLVIVRWQFLQVLRVPSASMAPFVHGDPEEGDRIVVFKKAFLRREPARLEPVVFQAGEGAGLQYLLKRVAGLAGEAVSVQGGDLFLRAPGEARAERFQKDYRQIQQVLVPVASARFTEEQSTQVRIHGDLVGGVLPLQGPSAGDAPWPVRFGRAVTDGYQGPGGDWIPGDHVVWDLLVRVTLVPTEPGTGVRVRLLEGMDQFEFELNAEEGTLRVTHVTAAGDLVPSEMTLNPEQRALWQMGRAVTVEFWNVDQTLGVALEGQPLYQSNHRPVGDYLQGPDEGPGFALLGGAAEVTGFQVLRDLHYTIEADATFLGEVIPEGHVFVLGDHSAGSRDSRQFGPVALDDLVGSPLAVCLPWHRARWLR